MVLLRSRAGARSYSLVGIFAITCRCRPGMLFEMFHRIQVGEDVIVEAGRVPGPFACLGAPITNDDSANARHAVLSSSDRGRSSHRPAKCGETVQKANQASGLRQGSIEDVCLYQTSSFDRSASRASFVAALRRLPAPILSSSRAATRRSGWISRAA